MTLVKKITKTNFLPETELGKVPVYADKFNYLIDLLFGTELTVGTIQADTISEVTSGAGVTIDGVLIKDGAITLTSPIIQSVDADITALGTDDTDGYALTKQFNVITGGAANTGVELPLAQVGQTIIVANLTASAKKVYANTSDQIDDKTATTGFVTLQPEQVIVFRSYTTALWQSDYEAEGVYDVLYTNTISENTAGAGVTIDSVLLKDNTILVGAGAVGTPSVQVGAADTGFYQISDTQTGFAQDGTLVALFDGNGIKADSVRPRVALGSTPGGIGTISAVEYGDGRNMTTVITLTEAVIGAPTAGASEALGELIYSFPAGAHLHEVSYMSVGLTIGGVTTDTPDVGIGSVIATGAVAVLGGTATFEDYITGQTATNCSGTATVKTSVATAGALTDISINEAANAKTVHLNVADAWDAGVTGNLTATGTITLKWTKLSA